MLTLWASCSAHLKLYKKETPSRFVVWRRHAMFIDVTQDAWSRPDWEPLASISRCFRSIKTCCFQWSGEKHSQVIWKERGFRLHPVLTALQSGKVHMLCGNWHHAEFPLALFTLHCSSHVMGFGFKLFSSHHAPVHSFFSVPDSLMLAAASSPSVSPFLTER